MSPPSPCAAVAVACALSLGGCGDAVLVVVGGDLEVPTGVDAICLAIADRDPAGGGFGRMYRLEGALASLPQSLAVEAGGASQAEAWVRGYRGGVEVARDRAGVDFGGDVDLRLDRCGAGSSAAPATVGSAGPADAVLVPSMGRGGAIVVAIGGGAAARIDAVGGEVVAAELALGAAVGAVAIDADGDCDDDLVVWTDSEARLYTRGVDDFSDAGAVASLAVRAAIGADVDRDGDQDLVLGGGGELRLYRNDGAGSFALDDGGIPGGTVTDVTALALGDLDGDGNPDLIAGQGDAIGAPPRAYLGNPEGDGVFTLAPAILPDVGLRIRGLALADADGDGDLDLGVALAGAPLRLYVNRGGRLEDQSFVRLPQPAPTASGVAAAEWTGDCRPDLAAAAPAGSVLLRGADDEALVDDAPTDGATAAAFVDLDDDGDFDLVLATPAGVAWVRR